MKDCAFKRFLIKCYEIFYVKREDLKLRLKHELSKHNRLSIMNYKKTLRYIERYKCCIARYGDGEFDLINAKSLGFQNYSDKLTEKLKETLKNRNPNLLICIPSALNSVWGIKRYGAWKYWASVWSGTRRVELENLLKKYLPDYTYGDSLITRPYMDYQSKLRAEYTYGFFKRLFKSKHILIVEGCFSRLGLNNDLFDTASSIKRILVPAKDAFEKYEEIYNAVTEYGKEKLILLAIGPTATVLASDLANTGGVLVSRYRSY